MIRNHAGMLYRLADAVYDGLYVLESVDPINWLLTIVVFSGFSYWLGTLPKADPYAQIRELKQKLEKTSKEKDGVVAELAVQGGQINHLTGQNAELKLDIRAHERSREIVK